MDKITLERIQTAHPKERSVLESIYTEISSRLSGRVICRFPYVIRTFKEQDDLFAIGRTVIGRNPRPGTPMGDVVTWARGGQSFHNYGLAADACLLFDKDGNGTYETLSYDLVADMDKDGRSDFREIVEVFQMHGWDWGGGWPSPKTDNPHFQKTYGYSVMQLKKLFDEKKFITNTNYVII